MCRRLKFFLFCACLISTFLAQSKVLIITHNYNRPEFIETQYKAFERFLEDPYEYVVFNDASNPQIADQINEECARIGIKCIKVPQEKRTQPNGQLILEKGIFWASKRHTEAIHYSMENLGFQHNGIVVMIDCDLFLLKRFSPVAFLKDYDIAGLLQKRAHMSYMWAGLIFFNMNNLPNKEMMRFNNGVIGDLYVDTGASLHYYFEANPDIKIFHFDQRFRHFFDENFNSYILPSEFLGADTCFWHTYQLCDKCLKAFPEPQYRYLGCKCSHKIKVLQDMGIDKKIVQYIEQKKFPPLSELILKDTFIHFQEAANYNKLSEDFYLNKKRMFFEFMNDFMSA